MKKYFFAKYLVLLTGIISIAGLQVPSISWAQEKPSQDFLDAQQSFLDDFAKKEGVIERPSGLLVKRVRAGKGKFPTKTGRVVVHYEGKLADGTVFDSSYARNQPITFGVSEVIKGWSQALLLMREGSKWELAIPSHIGYGIQGSPPVIPAHATLHFVVELITVQ